MKPMTFAPRLRQAGFTLIEMMVALTISLIVMLGFSVIFVGVKQAFNSQDKLAQLQDNERLALTLLTAAVQQAGYFPNPTTLDSTQIVNTTSTTYGSMAAGQAVTGMSASGGLESLSTAFAASANDGLMTCLGHTITAADIAAAPSAANGSVGVRNIFYVDASSNTLRCVALINGGASTSYGGSGDATTGLPLITNVTSMSVAYGVDTGTGSVSGYLPAASMTSANWSQVKAVRVTLNFINPNNSASTIAWTQTMNLMK